MTYAGMRGVFSGEDPDLGGNVHNGDPFSFAPRVWKYLVYRFGIRSVLDVGCGQGHAASFFSRLGCLTIAIDGLEENLRDPVFPIAIHDLRVAPFKAKVDLVHCVELVEHLEEKYLENLLRTLACGRILAMTHALPGQDGHHHVNCQTTEYWRGHLLNYGFSVAEEDTSRIRKMAELDGAAHFVASGLVFTRL